MFLVQSPSGNDWQFATQNCYWNGEFFHEQMADLPFPFPFPTSLFLPSSLCHPCAICHPTLPHPQQFILLSLGGFSFPLELQLLGDIALVPVVPHIPGTRVLPGNNSACTCCQKSVSPNCSNIWVSNSHSSFLFIVCDCCKLSWTCMNFGTELLITKGEACWPFSPLLSLSNSFLSLADLPFTATLCLDHTLLCYSHVQLQEGISHSNQQIHNKSSFP